MSQARPRLYHATRTHILEGRHRHCPICQWVLEQDHDEALAMNTGQLPEEFSFELVGAAAAEDSAARALKDNDLVFFVDPRVNPNDTMPFPPPTDGRIH